MEPPTGFVLDGTGYRTIDIPLPGAVLRDINDAGQIVRDYQDASGNHHGFLYDGGTVNPFDFPEAFNTEVYGVNNAGQIVGQYSSAVGGFHGFLLEGGVFSTIDFPEAGGTSALGINNGGQIVGRYDDSNMHAYVATPIPPGCGNEIIDPGEQCDDGNMMAGDGCSADCQLEPSQCELDLVQCQTDLALCVADLMPDQDGDGDSLRYTSTAILKALIETGGFSPIQL